VSISDLPDEYTLPTKQCYRAGRRTQPTPVRYTCRKIHLNINNYFPVSSSLPHILSVSLSLIKFLCQLSRLREVQELRTSVVCNFVYSSLSLPRLHSVRTGCRAHPASYPMGAGAMSLGIKRPGREADHFRLAPRSRIVKLYLHTYTSSWHSAQFIEHRDNFAFTVLFFSYFIFLRASITLSTCFQVSVYECVPFIESLSFTHIYCHW
jgi:hypothetical protein